MLIRELVIVVFSVLALVTCATEENANADLEIELTTLRNSNSNKYVPVVLWHGMGDSCCFPFSLGALTKNIQDYYPGIYIHSLKIGSSIVNDVENGYFLHPDKQIRMACDIIRADPNLQGEFNAIGFSQGAQFLRGLVQRCEGIKVRNLISVGGQHQGVYGLPNCGSLSHSSCNYLRRLLNHAAYIRWVQRSLVQATYWHDPLHEKEYQKGSTFIADINNEVVQNESYKKKILALNTFVMVKFENDTMVEPVETEWFGFYKPGQSKVVESLQESEIYATPRDATASIHPLIEFARASWRAKRTSPPPLDRLIIHQWNYNFRVESSPLIYYLIHFGVVYKYLQRAQRIVVC